MVLVLAGVSTTPISAQGHESYTTRPAGHLHAQPRRARLVTFEEVLAEFLTGKTVQVDARRGLTIISEDGSKLDESQLSSGEYQLLYLMVAALTTRRRGTVIAIDEPELSMHIAWQRRLVPSLVRCASRAAPQFILATHSPDIAAGYPESMVELGAG